MEPIILASSSLRRQEILKQLGFPFTVMTPQVDEKVESTDPLTMVQDISRKKADYVLSVITDRFLPWVLGGDTLIYHQGKVIGKPSSREEADEFISSFSGSSHSVFSGLALYSGRSKSIITQANETVVHFKKISPEEKAWYLDSGEWQGVAGAYRIQGKAAFFIDRIEGQYHSVVGLPISDLYDILGKSGYIF
jgi:septum formation protein